MDKLLHNGAMGPIKYDTVSMRDQENGEYGLFRGIGDGTLIPCFRFQKTVVFKNKVLSQESCQILGYVFV